MIVSNQSQQQASAILKEPISDLLFVDNRLLNPLNEMKKRFGSSIVEQIERENNPLNQAALANMSAQRYIISFINITNLILFYYSRRAHQIYQHQQQQRPSTRTAKQNAFIVPKPGWPPYFKFGKNS